MRVFVYLYDYGGDNDKVVLIVASSPELALEMVNEKFYQRSLDKAVLSDLQELDLSKPAVYDTYIYLSEI